MRMASRAITILIWLVACGVKTQSHSSLLTTEGDWAARNVDQALSLVLTDLRGSRMIDVESEQRWRINITKHFDQSGILASHVDEWSIACMLYSPLLSQILDDSKLRMTSVLSQRIASASAQSLTQWYAQSITLIRERNEIPTPEALRLQLRSIAADHGFTLNLTTGPAESISH